MTHQLISAAEALEGFREVSAGASRRIVFTQPEREAVLRTASRLASGALAHPILVGDATEIGARAQELQVNLNGVDIRTVEPGGAFRDVWRAEGAARGIREVEAGANLALPFVFARAMLRLGQADALMCGPGSEARGQLLSGDGCVRILVVGSPRAGLSLVTATADASPPSAVRLAEIALQAVELGLRLSGQKPAVFFLVPDMAVPLKRPGRFRSAREELEHRAGEAIATVRARDEDLDVAASLYYDLSAFTNSTDTRLKAFVLTRPATPGADVRAFEPAWTVGPVFVGSDETWGTLSEASSVDDMVLASVLTGLSVPRSASDTKRASGASGGSSRAVTRH